METHATAQLTALSLQQQLREFAEQIVACVQERVPAAFAADDAVGRSESLRHTGYLLAYLADAVYVETPGLFVEYIRWSKVLFAGMHLPDTVLPEALACLRDLLNRRLAPAQAELATAYVQDALDAYPQALSALPSYLTTAIAPPFDGLAAQYLEHLLHGRRDEATFQVLSAVKNGVDVKEIYLHVFQPVLLEVGRLWQMHEISVAQEHYITAATQLTMALLAPSILTTPKNGLRLVATCVSGELHELGARMVADFFEMAGWDTYYLGANTPTESVISALAETNAELLVLSATLPKHVSAVAHLIAAVRASAVGHRVLILVGGYPFSVSPDLWQRIGADGSAPDALTAVAVAQQLLDTRQPAAMQTPLDDTAEPPALPPDVESMDAPIFHEISKLNNELIVLHREMQKKNNELNQLIEQKNRFLGMASHDLRNPLNAIQGYCGLLLDETGPLTAEQRDYLDMIQKSSKFMRLLVDDLLTTVQFDSGKLKLDLQRADLVGVIQNTLDTLEMSAHEKQIALECISEPIPEFVFDPMRIEQAVQNLVSNAIKFSNPQSTIAIHLYPQNVDAVIAVTDHGRGISPEQLKTIFTPFLSINRQGTAGERGTGLGLVITQHIIAAHHGRLDIASEVGNGSTFTITLPLTCADDPPTD